jgi:fido (protein-threonine AMPylation protein)
MKRHLLYPDGLKTLHSRIYSELWGWGGVIRKSTRHSLGRGLERLRVRLHEELSGGAADLSLVAVEALYTIEAAQPFYGGNWQIARLVADLLLIHHHQRPLPWAGRLILSDSKVQRVYYQAMSEAANGSFESLYDFATSSEEDWLLDAEPGILRLEQPTFEETHSSQNLLDPEN